MGLNDIELHDALIVGTVINYSEKTIVIEVQFYNSSDEVGRKGAKIYFEGVSCIHQNSDFNDLEKNAFAGNINYWVPAENDGKTYIYLVNGCISITSESVRFEENDIS